MLQEAATLLRSVLREKVQFIKICSSKVLKNQSKRSPHCSKRFHSLISLVVSKVGAEEDCPGGTEMAVWNSVSCFHKVKIL